ncbi:MAG: YidC/Oxa1 family membrane protein insertase, partial [Pseudomonadota bacterium]|nr:YidC/Oxa1 family membrane protein insertase [Pseudomonadota bacterium]
LPIVFTFLLGGFPAGLVIYWAWNNTLSIGQQWLIMRQMGVSASGETINAEPPKAPPRGNKKSNAAKANESGKTAHQPDPAANATKAKAKSKATGKTRRRRTRR